MAKKRNPRRTAPDDESIADSDEALHYPAPQPDHPPPLNPAPDSLPLPSLAHIRDNALRQINDNARTIAELESWRAEIDSTIAYLKSQRR